MKHQSKISTLISPKTLLADEMATFPKRQKEMGKFFQQHASYNLDDLLLKLVAPMGKKSFLVFKNNKYFSISTDNIAFFYVKNEASLIVCFDRQEYSVSHSLEQIQHLLAERDFYRINRQYLVNFNAVKEVEHYFARKLLVNLVMPSKENLLVPKEKVSSFLYWLDNR